MKKMEVPDREDLLNLDSRATRGHRRKVQKDSFRRNLKKRTVSPKRVVHVWNRSAKAVVYVKTIHKFKAKLDAMRYKHRTPRAQLPFP